MLHNADLVSVKGHGSEWVAVLTDRGREHLQRLDSDIITAEEQGTNSRDEQRLRSATSPPAPKNEPSRRAEPNDKKKPASELLIDRLMELQGKPLIIPKDTLVTAAILKSYNANLFDKYAFTTYRESLIGLLKLIDEVSLTPGLSQARIAFETKGANQLSAFHSFLLHVCLSSCK